MPPPWQRDAVDPTLALVVRPAPLPADAAVVLVPDAGVVVVSDALDHPPVVVGVRATLRAVLPDSDPATLTALLDQCGPVAPLPPVSDPWGPADW